LRPEKPIFKGGWEWMQVFERGRSRPYFDKAGPEAAAARLSGRQIRISRDTQCDV
jgi:hypothetical protein